VQKGYTKLSYTSLKGINTFAWPATPDIMVTLNEDILIQPIVVQPVNSRGHLAMSKKEYDRAKTLMVVVYWIFFHVFPQKNSVISSKNRNNGIFLWVFSRGGGGGGTKGALIMQTSECKNTGDYNHFFRLKIPSKSEIIMFLLPVNPPI